MIVDTVCSLTKKPAFTRFKNKKKSDQAYKREEAEK